MSEWRTVVFRLAAIGGLVASWAALAGGVIAANPGTAAAAVTSGIAPLPTPVGTFSGGSSVSCTGPGDCTSIGEDGNWAVETDGSWVSQPSLSPAFYSAMAVSCIDPGDCTIVGNDAAGNGAYQTETAGTWGAVTAFPSAPQGTFQIPSGSGFYSTANHQLSCTGPGDCTAIGVIAVPGSNYPAAVTETDGTWGSPVLLGSGSTLTTGFEPAGVSCVSPGNCTVVGDYVFGATILDSQGFVATERAGAWTTYGVDPITGLLAPGSSIGFFYPFGISCSDASDCTVVGMQALTPGSDVAVYVSESGGTWGAVTDFTGSVPPGGAYSTASGLFNGVSCVDASDCIGVGYDQNGAQTFAIETGGVWGPATEAGNVGSQDGFNDVSCTSALYCTAVGLAGVSGFYSSTNTPSVMVTDNAASISAGDTLTFTATVTGTDTPAPSGSVTWTMLDPGDAPCDTTTGPTASGNHSTYTCSITNASAGVYNAQADFGGDANYAQASGSNQATVSSQVGPAAQTISFTAPASGTVGGSDTLSATGGGSGNPVVFSVDASSGAGVCNVSGTNGTKVNYTAAGSCVIDANQDGNANYLAAPQVEQTISVASVTPATPTIATTQQPASATVGSSIADKATVSGGDSPAGTVTFNLYDNPNGTGTPLFTDTESLTGGSATSASYKTTAAGTDYWVATYNGDSNDNAVSSGNAAESVVIGAATPSISTSQQPASVTVGSSIADQATVSGGDSPAGTVTFNLYDNPNGTGTPLFTDTDSLTGGSATSASYKTTAAGTDYWVATYNGDSNNNKVTSGSGSESVVIASPPPPVCGAAPGIVTQPSGQTVTAPAAASFSAAGSTPANCAAPSVQWYSEPPGTTGFSPIAGATSASYTTPATTTAQSGTKYEAVFANAFGSSTTNPATLTVNAVATTAQWTATGAMNSKRAYADLVRLPNGEVLMMGGATGPRTVIASSLKTAELYDPATGKWTATGSMAHARYAFPAVLLPDGKVLVVGGYGGGDLSSAELYDPATQKWSSAHSVGAPRDSATATLLKNGKVLVAGGDNDGTVLSGAKLYHPATNTWSTTGPMKYAVYGATATLLKDGRVLVTGGGNARGYPNTVAQLYDPTTGTWSKTAPLPSPRWGTTATLLPNGKVLLAGGQKGFLSGSALNTAILYDPSTGKWSTTGSMTAARTEISASELLRNGTVLVAGGYNATGTLASAEIYNPATGAWTRTAPMHTARRAFGGFSMATVLSNGNVLVAGGINGTGFLNTSELYTP